jgi:hypothetical protein
LFEFDQRCFIARSAYTIGRVQVRRTLGVVRYGGDWLRRTAGKFLKSRRNRGDLSGKIPVVLLHKA